MHSPSDSIGPRFCFGEVPPSVEGWWSKQPPFKWVETKAYTEASDDLNEHLLARLCLKYELRSIESCYVVGQPFGDYTQYVEVNEPRLFTAELILDIKRWVERNPVWRVATPLQFGSKGFILIYENSIRYVNEEYISLSEICFDIQSSLFFTEGNK